MSDREAQLLDSLLEATSEEEIELIKLKINLLRSYESGSE